MYIVVVQKNCSVHTLLGTEQSIAKNKKRTIGSFDEMQNVR